jgi:hypothetical protein
VVWRNILVEEIERARSLLRDDPNACWTDSERLGSLRRMDWRSLIQRPS